MKTDIVITGMGAVTCLGVGVDTMWRALLVGRCGIGPLTKLDPSKHRITHAGEVRDMPPHLFGDAPDPALRFLLAACSEAVGQAGLSTDELSHAALVAASNFGCMTSTERLLAGDGSSSELAFPAGATDTAASVLGVGGVRTTLSLSCASGNAALGRAADLIRSGAADAVVACGYDAISEVVWAGLCSLRAMSSTALRPFDRRRNGTIFSEGAGALVLEKAEHALARGARPLASLLGYGSSSNAFHLTLPDPDGSGIARAMAAAMRDAGVQPTDIDHINSHGTGTPFNDRVETRAIKSVLGARAYEVPISAIKSMLGHAMGAAGALEAIAVVMAIREGIVPPTIGLDEPDPECDLDYTPLYARRHEVRFALNNSAGFGGCNACVVIGRWEE